MEILNQKVFTLCASFSEESTFLPSETNQILDRVELVKQAAHYQIENPKFLQNSKVEGFKEQYYNLPNFQLSYLEAEKIGMLDLFRHNGRAVILINREWLLQQDIWRVEIIGRQSDSLLIGVTTPPATVLEFIVNHLPYLKLKEGKKNVYTLSLE